MKKMTFLAAVAVALTMVACDKAPKNATEIAQQVADKVEMPDIAKEAIAKYFSENTGKYPLSELNITNNPVIAEPLKKLVGEERFAQLGQKLTTETPLELVGEAKDTLQFSIGEPHNVAHNNITVQYAINTGKLRVVDTTNGQASVKE